MNMPRLPDIRRHEPRQRGAALLVALLMLIVLLMFGIAAIRIGLQSEKISRNWRDRQIAWQAAEAALLDGEYAVGHFPAPPPALFSDLPSALKTAGADYGSLTGRIMQTGIGALPARRPRYLIETLPPRADRPAHDHSTRYRISAIGFGPDPDTTVVLQSIYRQTPDIPGSANKGKNGKGSDAAVPSALPSMRLNWREILIGEAESGESEFGEGE
ncbi:MAG TPA: PilX N-terminal domain-containing pilus assembly protein [Herbaspirillum sp.]|jgi:type IV pilus assembly protein PilX